MTTTDEPRDLSTTPIGTTAVPRHRLGTVIVGAGQTGLATAYHLTRVGHPCVVLDEHQRTGDQWRQRYDSLRLNTPAHVNNLPGMPFPAPRHSFPSGHDMADYLQAYVEQHGIEVRHGTRVRRIDRCEDGTFEIDCGDEVLVAEDVVVATGGEHLPHVPDTSARLDPGIRQLHSSDYRNPGQLLPGPVLVVGASQSGADLALEIAGAGHETTLSGEVKGELPFELGTFKSRLVLPVLLFLAHHVLTLRNPLGRKVQPIIRAGGTPLVRVKRHHLETAGVRMLSARTTGVDDDGRPVLDDGTVLDVANVVWCTGFDQGFGFIHPPVTGKDGWPRDRGGVVPEAPGLYFMGLLFQRGFYSMLIGGAGRDAKFIARHVVRRARSRTRT
jgi:putative flavoprotein involved in K+ transport